MDTFDDPAVFTTKELIAAGHTKREIAEAVADGTATRVRRGIFLRDPVQSSLDFAKLFRGSVTCLSALRHYGIWTPTDSGLHHIRVKRRQRYRLPPELDSYLLRCRVHSLTDDPAIPDGQVDSFTEAIRCAVRCTTHEQLVAILESVMRVNHFDLLGLDLPRSGRLGAAVAAASPRPGESGVETLVRLRMERLRISFQTQCWVGPYRLDFLVGERLVIEIDGFEFHADQQSFRRDRERDRYLELRGYRVLRFTAAEVLYDWDACEAEILAAVRARIHRRG